jgi:hypothetical protein
VHIADTPVSRNIQTIVFACLWESDMSWYTALYAIGQFLVARALLTARRACLLRHASCTVSPLPPPPYLRSDLFATWV